LIYKYEQKEEKRVRESGEKRRGEIVRKIYRQTEREREEVRPGTDK